MGNNVGCLCEKDSMPYSEYPPSKRNTIKK